MTAQQGSETPRRLFRMDVGTLMVGMVLVQAALLLGLGYWGGHRLLYTVGHAAHEEEHARLQADLQGFMALATSAVRALAAAPRHGNVTDPHERSAELVWSLMAESRALDQLYFIDHDGDVLGVQRHPVPALRRVRQNAGRFAETLELKPGLEQAALSPDRRFLTTEVQRRTTDDVRAEPWIIAAKAGERPVWTQQRLLPGSGEMGVTFAAPDVVPDAQGRTDGVAAGDIALRHLHGFVASFSHAGAGDSAVLDGDGHVLARSDGTETDTPFAGSASDILTTILPAVAARPLDAEPITHDGARYLIRATAIPGTQWRLVSWLPEEVVVGGLRRGLVWAGGVLAACLAAALVASLWLSRRVTGPIEVLAGVARRIGRLELDGLPQVNSPVEEVFRLDQALGESARSLRALRKFVPSAVVNDLVRQGRSLEPGGDLTEVTVMFTDIEGFTGISATVPPAVLVPQLTEYFNAAAAVLVAHGGTIDKYIGDGMMVLWGAPKPQADAAWQACTAALALQAALDELNAQWATRGLPRLHTRIGIHSGPAVAGVLGSSERLSYTAFGDTVNVASRLESLNKELGTRILASSQTVAALGGRVATRAMGEVSLRGHSSRWQVYELLAADVPLNPAS